jgi:hypothetical protein
MSASRNHSHVGSAPVVLAKRRNAGVNVTLLWAEDTNAVAVRVRDDNNDDHFELPVEPGANALHVFEHPYAYAARQGVEYRLAA